VGQEQLLRAAARFSGEFIVKHHRGGKGLGVEKFSSFVDLATRLHGGHMEAPVDGTYLVQQYIRAPEQFITR
jgi:glutathione synthase/RimK-type ligase-like ATP-grasp enzyme